MDATAEREGLAIKRLLRLAPRNIGSNPHAILWQTIARQSTCMEQTAFARWFIAEFNCTSSGSRSKGNVRRKAKRN